MTTQNKASLQALFEQGDVPSGTNYSDLIDSCLNVAETSAQTLLSQLTVTEMTTPRVSADNGNFTGNVTVSGSVSAGSGNFSGTLKSAALTATAVSATSINLTADVSADGTVYGSAMRSINGVFCGTGIVSAAGSTQATAAILTNVINRGKGIVDGSTTGFAPMANRAGLVQYLFNEGASANLWPPTGGTINGLAANAVLALAASAMVTIVHLTASAYAVK